MTRFVYISYRSTVETFIEQLNNFIASGYTTLLGNMSQQQPNQPMLREVLLENNGVPLSTGVTLVKNY